MISYVFLSAILLSSPTTEIKPGEKQAPKIEDAAESELSGFYIASGKQNGNQYAFPVVIIKVGKGYAVHWCQGNKTITGFGVLKGSQLSVSWSHQTPNALITGVSIYTVGKKSFRGIWTTNHGQSGEEVLDRVLSLENGANEEADTEEK